MCGQIRRGCGSHVIGGPVRPAHRHWRGTGDRWKAGAIMNPQDTSEIIGKALLVGVLAVLVGTSAETVAVVSSVAAVFCLGRWIQKQRR